MPSNSPTNLDVALKLGVSHASVSRYRAGNGRTGSRIPKFAVQQRIAEQYGWSVASQANAIARGKYAEGLERALCRSYRRELAS